MRDIPSHPTRSADWRDACRCDGRVAIDALHARGLASVLLVVILWLLPASRALAKQDGIDAQGCVGCHKGGKETTPILDAGVASAPLGGVITITLTIPAVNGPVAGMYLYTNGKGTLSVIDGQGTKLNGDGITHSAPKRAVGNTVTFQVKWTAPSTPGGVTFDAWVLSANGDGTSNGDGDGHAYLALSYGCPGNDYYNDGDNDGYGSAAFPAIRDCTKPPFFSDNNTDCNDYDEKIHPGAPEVCNKKDDNCNGLVDEGLPIDKYYTDNDGDGYGAGSIFILDCGPSKGYGVGNMDCNDNDPTIHPGAPEVCNYKDDNCNGFVDEGVRAECGTGWCKRQADGCGPEAVCTPGNPRPEQCNGFDDDCDGVVDNGRNLCAGNDVCIGGLCLPPGTSPPVSSPSAPADQDGGGAAVSPSASNVTEVGGCNVGGTDPSISAVGWLFTLVGAMATRKISRRS